MKLNSLILFVAIAGMLTQPVRADETPQPKEVTVAIGDVLLPEGRTANDEVVIVASGMFPNSCYRWKGSVVKEVENNLHTVEAKAAVTQGMCLMVLVPYTKTISLGKLSSGSHTLRFVNNDGTYMEKTIDIH